MSESIPFLLGQGRSPRLNSSPRLTSSPRFTSSPPRSPSLPSYHKEKLDDDLPYRDDPSASSLPLPVSTSSVTRRSKLRLTFLITLALGGIVVIASWQTPDHIKSKAIDYVNTATDSMDDYWSTAKGWAASTWQTSSQSSPHDAAQFEEFPGYESKEQELPKDEELQQEVSNKMPTDDLQDESQTFDAPQQNQEDLTKPAASNGDDNLTGFEEETSSGEGNHKEDDSAVSDYDSRPEDPSINETPNQDLDSAIEKLAEDASGDSEADQVDDIKEEQIPSAETLEPQINPTLEEEGATEQGENKPAVVPVAATDIPVVHPLYVLPNPMRKPSGDPEEKFVSFLPHSDFHNQRIAVVNAMELAYVLNRTLLLPPAWVGWPATTHMYTSMQNIWTDTVKKHPEAFSPKAEHAPSFIAEELNSVKRDRQISVKRQAANLTEEQCKSYSKECQSTYQDTFISWDFLTDLKLAEKYIKIVDRWNMTREHMLELTGVKSVADEVYLLQDLDKYYFHFHDVDEPGMTELLTEMPPTISHVQWKYTVSIPKLQAATKNHKILEIGSLFGTGRLYLQLKDNMQRFEYFQRSLAFNTPVLSAPANTISQLLGGADGYFGIHARVGDGYFFRRRDGNMRNAFESMLKKLNVKRQVWPRLIEAAQKKTQQLLEEEKANKSSRKRSLKHLEGRSRHSQSETMQAEQFLSMWSGLDEEIPSAQDFADLPKRNSPSIQKRQKMWISQNDYSTQLKPVKTRADSALDPSLQCRGELYTDPDLLMLNNPVYIATDARYPLANPALTYFFANLPCAFILSDFDKPNPHNLGEPVHSLKVMEGAVNENDGIKLGRLLLPFMEAMIAAKAAGTIGTEGSTFSSFAAGALHESYWMEAHGRH